MYSSLKDPDYNIATCVHHSEKRMHALAKFPTVVFGNKLNCNNIHITSG